MLEYSKKRFALRNLKTRSLDTIATASANNLNALSVFQPAVFFSNFGESRFDFNFCTVTQATDGSFLNSWCTAHFDQDFFRFISHAGRLPPTTTALEALQLQNKVTHQ